VILAIAAGLLTAGIAGALLAVPLLAVLNSGIRSLRSDADRYTRPQTCTPANPKPPPPTNPASTGTRSSQPEASTALAAKRTPARGIAGPRRTGADGLAEVFATELHGHRHGPDRGRTGPPA
jgi:hypothetical protein